MVRGEQINKKLYKRGYLFISIAIRIKLFLVLVICLSISSFAQPTNKNDLVIDHAYLRKFSHFDNGTAHVFLKNKGNRPVAVTRVLLNDVPLPQYEVLELELSEMSSLEGLSTLQEPEDERIIWYQILPNPIPPGKVGDIQIKWAYPPYKLIRVTVETNLGQKLSRVIQPINNLLRVTYVGFNKSFNKVYIYLESTYKEKLEVRQIFLDSEDVTDSTFKPWQYIFPDEKKCIQLNLREPLNKGKYVSVKIVTKERIIAESLVRVSALFPITTYSGFKPDFNLDPGDYRRHCRDSLNLSVKESPIQRMCHVLDCPTHGHGSYRNAGKNAVVKVSTCCQERAPFYPTSMYICKAGQERGSFLFGEIADIVISNTAEPHSFRKDSREESPTQRTAYIMKQGSSPNPFHALPITGFDSRFPEFKNRLLTPEEERLIVYYNLSRGAKGIFYYLPSWEKGDETERTKLRREIKAINTELKLLKAFLVVGEYVTLAQTDEPMVNASTIVSGYEAIVLMLINDDYESKPEKGSNAFNHKPKGRFDVNVTIPEGMEIKEVSELIAGIFLPIEYHYKEGKVTIPVDGLDITRLILLESAPDYKQHKAVTADIQKRAVVKIPVHIQPRITQRSPEETYFEAKRVFDEINKLKWDHENLKKYDEVVELLEETISSSKEEDLILQAQELILQCYSKQAEYSKKSLAFDRYVEMVEKCQGKDEAVKKIIEAADSHAGRGEYYDAKSYYRKLLEKFAGNTRSVYAQYKIGECYSGMGIYEKAIVEYRKILYGHDVRDEWAEKACLKLVGVLHREKRWSEGIEVLREFLRRFPDSDFTANARFYLGHFYYQKRDYRQAEREFDELLTRYPESTFANLAKSFLRRIRTGKSRAKE